MNQAINFKKVNEFYLLKEEFEEFGQQSKSLDNKNMRLKHLVCFEVSK